MQTNHAKAHAATHFFRLLEKETATSHSARKTNWGICKAFLGITENKAMPELLATAGLPRLHALKYGALWAIAIALATNSDMD